MSRILPLAAWFIGWVLANAVGLAVFGAVFGFDMVETVIEPMGVFSPDEALSQIVYEAVDNAAFGAAFGTMFGAVIGTAQWYILRRRVYRSGWWILASTMGGAVGFVVAMVGGAIPSAPLRTSSAWAVFGVIVGVVSLVMFGAMFGAVMGTMQWWVLRQRVRQSGWWILASTAGWAPGWTVSILAVIVFGAFGDETAVGAVGLAASGIVFGAITGLPLVWLLEQPVRE